jgi:phosphoribosylaminoimidazole (AIR) synthetase
MATRDSKRVISLKRKLKVGSKIFIVLNNNQTVRSVIRLTGGGLAIENITTEIELALDIEIENCKWAPSRVAEMISLRLYPEVGNYAIDHHVL